MKKLHKSAQLFQVHKARALHTMKKPLLAASHNTYNEMDLAGIIMRSDMLVSDLDDTAAKSPSKAAVFHFLRDTRMLAKPAFVKWAFKAGYTRLKDGKKAESGLWKEFTESFLRDKQAIQSLEKRLTADYVSKRFFPGALEFYAELPKGMKRVYMTRSINAIAEHFRQAAGFDTALAEQYDKAGAVREITKRFPEKRRYVLIGDSDEDSEALDYLKFLWRYVKIDTLVSIYVAENDGKINKRFDINIGRDYTGLAKLVSSIPLSSSQ